MASQGLPHVDTLTISGYRCLQHLEIGRLGRLNLFVGKNGSGKTSVLEAVRIYGTAGSLPVLWDIVSSRQEDAVATAKYEEDSDPRALLNLFHSWPRETEAKTPIEIRDGGFRTIRIAVEWIHSESRTGRFNPLIVQEKIPELVVNVNGMIRFHPRLDRPFEPSPRGLYEPDPDRNEVTAPVVSVGSGGLGNERAALLWDSIVLTEFESQVVDALSMVFPELERISLVAGNRGFRIPVARMRGSARPVPVAALGDGASRLFGLAVALVCASGGLLLIDEVENGLHYTVLDELWRFVLAAARARNVQVFATTHSSDCVRAFESLAGGNDPGDVTLTRLETTPHGTRAVRFEQTELAVVLREEIEVR